VNRAKMPATGGGVRGASPLLGGSVPVGGLDWSRLPTFRSPGHEQERQPWYQRVVQRVTAPARGR
jgi:hypothetical protein